MKTDLIAIEDALAGLTDLELRALIVATTELPQFTTARSLAWIEGACKWEVSRRVGREYKLLPPNAAINPSEDAVSIQALHALRESFAAGDVTPAMLKFFDALAELLTGGGRTH